MFAHLAVLLRVRRWDRFRGRDTEVEPTEASTVQMVVVAVAVVASIERIVVG